MLKIATIVWTMLGTTLAGIAMLVIVATPPLADDAMRLIPIACGAGALLAMPLSWMIARRMSAASRPGMQH